MGGGHFWLSQLGSCSPLRSKQRPGTLLSILRCPGQPPPQRMHWHVSTAKGGESCADPALCHPPGRPERSAAGLSISDRPVRLKMAHIEANSCIPEAHSVQGHRRSRGYNTPWCWSGAGRVEPSGGKIAEGREQNAGSLHVHCGCWSTEGRGLRKEPVVLLCQGGVLRPTPGAGQKAPGDRSPKQSALCSPYVSLPLAPHLPAFQVLTPHPAPSRSLGAGPSSPPHLIWTRTRPPREAPAPSRPLARKSQRQAPARTAGVKLLIPAARTWLWKAALPWRTPREESRGLGCWLCVLRSPVWGVEQVRVALVSSTVPGMGLRMGLAVNCCLLAGVNASLLCSALLSGEMDTISTEGPRWWRRRWQRQQQHPACGQGCRIPVSPCGVHG